MFSGSVTPILNKLLTVANFGRLTTSGDEKWTLPNILRVEPWGKSQQPPTARAQELDEGGATDQVQQVVDVASEASMTTGTETPDVGQMVARKCGNSIFRGVIDEVRAQKHSLSFLESKNSFDACQFQCKDGYYHTRFTDKCSVKMNTEEVKTAQQLFDAELEKLVVEAKVPRAMASSISMTCTATVPTNRFLRRPVLEEGDEETTTEYERIFEDEYSGEVPDVLVGLEFPQTREIRWHCQRTKNKEEIYLPFWEFVLRKLSEKRLDEGALTSNDLLSQEKEMAKFATK